MDSLYEELLAAALPHTAAVLTYHFALPSLESVVDVHAQCQNARDEFIVQIGRWQLKPGVTVELGDESKRKGHRFTLTVNDTTATVSRKAAKDLLLSFVSHPGAEVAQP